MRNTLGPISLLINDAGVVEPVGPTVQVDPDVWTQSIATNLTGAFYLIHACLPTMLSQGWGRILNISSAAAAAPGLMRGNAYTVSKAGLESLTVNLAKEIAGSGVTVNAVRPGIVAVEMAAHIRCLPVEQVGPQIFERLATETTGKVISVYGARGKELLAG